MQLGVLVVEIVVHVGVPVLFQSRSGKYLALLTVADTAVFNL